MMNAEMPRAPRRMAGASVRAMTRMTPAWLPADTQDLVPSSTQWSPSRTACVRSDAASEPASDSDNANAPSNSPRAIGARKRCFCSSLPKRRIICVGSELCTDIKTAADASAAAISSRTRR